MPDAPNLWSIVSVALAIVATLVATFLALLTYGHHRRQALRFWEREQRLPDATRFENLKIRIEELQQEYDLLKDNIFDAQQTIEAAQYQRQWMDDAKEEIARLEHDKQEVARIQNELETAQIQLASFHEQRAALEGEINERKQKLDDLESQASQLRRQLVDLAVEVEKADRLRQELMSLEEQKRASREEAERLNREALDLRNRIESELRDLKRQRDDSQKEADALDKAIDNLAKTRDSLNDERRSLKKEIEKLEARAGALGEQIPVMQSTIDHLTSTVNHHDGATAPEENEVWQPVLFMGAEGGPAQTDEGACLDDLKRYLRSKRLKFDDRALYAFHTSLKTTDSSPLVALAGVSGTGKSELPRRYAEALGMNFLNVAVQPRWDGPQDLFGFYDYLERRFRPTDLTRALIQMDTFGARQDRGWNPPEGFELQRFPNQMLLVLLDEMNLARFEYYFSEFLSRLETRRGIDLNDDQKRVRAEISLDIGGRRAGQLPMQLFVDNNVLFVGTMNEDETTQALSDKVIDRANVLRFGSPASIEPMPAVGENGTIAEDRPRLGRGTWKSWCRAADDLSGDDQRQLLDWMERLRPRMEDIQRPFAHRVARSILEYAANYPNVERRLEYVTADQIEQKILPKLMGLNPQDPIVGAAFEAIYTILDEVDDGILRPKIERCCQHDYFQWTGIDRSEV